MRGLILGGSAAAAFLMAGAASQGHAAVIAHWSFDSGTLTTDGTNITSVADATGNHNAAPGTGGTGGTGNQYVSAAFPVATSSVAGQYGQSLRFNGDNFLLFNNLTELMAANGAPSYSVSMWAKTETVGGGTGSAYATLSNWGNAPSTAGETRFTYAFGMSSATQIRAQTRFDNDTTNGGDIFNRNVTTPVAPNNGNWHMLSWTFDTTSGVITTYFDGAQVEQFTSAATSFAMANSSSSVGGMGIKGDSGTFLPAGVHLDEVWVMNQVLSPAEIQSLFSTNAIPEPTSLAVLGLGGLGLLARRRGRPHG